MAVKMPTNDVQSIPMTEEERRNRKYSPETLVKVLNALTQDGLVVLKDAIPVEIVDKLNDKMCGDTDNRLNDPSQRFNHGIKSNILQRPPLIESEYLSKDVYFNPFLLQLANAHLGSKPIWNWLTANTAAANTSGIRQPAHKDSEFDHPQFPYYFIANIPLCDFSVKNGSTEFWLGSHAHTTAADQIVATNDEMMKPYKFGRLGGPLPPITEMAKEQRMKIRPPIQPTCFRGDIMIRDIRTWHAGMPNSSDAHRIMLGLGYQSPFHANYSTKLHLPASQTSFFLHNTADVEVRAQWYEDEDLDGTSGDRNFFIRPAYLD